MSTLPRLSSPVRTVFWEHVFAYYSDLQTNHGWNIEPLIALARHLSSEPYGRALFPYTSHDVLCLGRVPNFEMQVNELSIQYIPQSGNFSFVYREAPSPTPAWATFCTADSWQLTLERVLHKRLRWFHQASR